ncbi:chitinase-3-like protein 2 isoform X2 [Bemisia tabaci]|uniref:chitinase-3-like protein 2 isoform X2 n=1 Tax=Bemisia tabaci TaxID=7038 RepID=UPI0008F995D6|nr:PREDICTED: chitinase-3-like protein 2 isoform X2 [Bemisia tabaci]
MSQRTSMKQHEARNPPKRMDHYKNSDLRYELLQEDSSFGPSIHQNRVNIMWVALCLIGLTTAVISAVVYLACSNYEEIFPESKLIEMDLIIFGPQKVVKGDYKFVKHRAEKYAQSTYDHANSTNWNTFAKNVHAEADQKFRYIPKKYKLVCYYTLPKNVSTGQLLPGNIDPNLCTHINLAFAFIENNGSIIPQAEADFEVYSQVIELKRWNPRLKVLISISCNDYAGKGLLDTINIPRLRKKFVSILMKFLDTHNLDGIDFDWEFPSWPDASPAQKEKFAMLLEDINLAFKRLPPERRYILSVAVAAPASIIDQAYNIRKMARSVDFINLMAYDYHYWTAYLPFTGPNAPIYAAANDYNYFATLNANWSVHKWVDEGMPKEKIILGVPTYAHTYELYNPLNHGFISPACGFGSSIGYDGFASYNEVCRFLSDPGVKMVFDHNTRTPYAFKDKDWISFDNIESLGYKASYVTENGLGGIMVWALNLDDYDGTCSNKPFPLVRRLNETLSDDFL